MIKHVFIMCLMPLLLMAQELAPYSKTFSAGPLELLVEMDRTQGGLDDVMQLSITTKAPADYSITLPDFAQGEILKNLMQAKPRQDAPVTLEDGRIARRTVIELEPLCIREPFKIGQFTVKFSQVDSKEHELSSEDIPLNITIPSDEEIEQRLNAELQNTTTPAKRLTPPSLKPYIYGACLVLLLLALLFLGIWYYRKKRREKAALPPPPIPPWLIAEKALAELRAEKLAEKGQFMDFYNRVQLILRTYLEDRFQIHAPERTTEEFLDELRTSHSPVTQYKEQLEHFLNHCDLVRFAAHIPEMREINETFEACNQFVKDTRPAPTETREAVK